MTRSKRAGQRREIHRQLKSVRETLTTVLNWWASPGGTIWDEAQEKWRDRRQDEYPEDKKNYWASTYSQIDKMIAELKVAQQYAYERYIEMEDK